MGLHLDNKHTGYLSTEIKSHYKLKLTFEKKKAISFGESNYKKKLRKTLARKTNILSNSSPYSALSSFRSDSNLVFFHTNTTEEEGKKVDETL